MGRDDRDRWCVHRVWCWARVAGRVRLDAGFRLELVGSGSFSELLDRASSSRGCVKMMACGLKEVDGVGPGESTGGGWRGRRFNGRAARWLGNIWLVGGADAHQGSQVAHSLQLLGIQESGLMMTIVNAILPLH